MRQLIAIAWLGLVVATLFGCDDALSAQLIAPSYVEPCKYTDCSGHGQCIATDAGAPQCLCELGYTSEACARCEANYHRDANGRCMPNVTCAGQTSDPCAPAGTCIDRDGTLACSCAEGYAGPRCNVCAERYARDEALGCLPIPFSPTGGSGGVGGMGGAGGSTQACDVGYGGPGCMLCATGFHRVGTGCVVDETCRVGLCPDHAQCQIVDGLAQCVCDFGYAGANCRACVDGYHAVGDDCVIDEVCDDDSCPDNARCEVVSGVVQCTCNASWEGEECDLCRPGRTQTLDFAPTLGFPSDTNTCYAPFGYPGSPYNAYQTSSHTLRSEGGYAPYRLCAPSTYNGFTTRHIELSTSTTTERWAEIEFSEPAVAVSFDVGVRLSTLALNVQAGSMQSGTLVYRALTNVTIDLAPQSNGSIALDNLNPPASVIRFVPKNGHAQVISFDNIVSHHGACTP